MENKTDIFDFKPAHISLGIFSSLFVSNYIRDRIHRRQRLLLELLKTDPVIDGPEKDAENLRSYFADAFKKVTNTPSPNSTRAPEAD